MTRQQPTAARAFSVIDIEGEIANALHNAPPQRATPMEFAPPAIRSPMPLMPTYVEHRDGIDDVGRLTAEAIVRAYEETAKEVEDMGRELTDRIKRLDETKAEALAVLAEIKETAAAFRETGKRVFLEIEDCSMMNAEVRRTCNAMKEKIATPNGSGK